MISKPKILFYDIETTPLQAWTWRCGKQYVRHNQLVDGPFNHYHIICITYCWNDNKPAKVYHWGYEEQNSAKLVEAFDKVISQADITIGKNSDRFDVKHINTQRMLAGLPGMPDWAQYTDDLEKQIRKHFYLPSYSLDYLSEQLGLGGKMKMEFNDWIYIVLKTKGEGRKRFKKMLEYGMKDVEDTRELWNKLECHFTPKYNMATYYQENCCATCGSSNIHKNGTRVKGKTRYQRFYCNAHGGHAGKAPIKKDGTIGKIGS